MATLTDNAGTVTQALVDLLRGDWDGLGAPTKDDIYYGDQDMYPRFPSFAVDPAPVARELYQTGFLRVFHRP